MVRFAALGLFGGFLFGIVFSGSLNMNIFDISTSMILGYFIGLFLDIVTYSTIEKPRKRRKRK